MSEFVLRRHPTIGFDVGGTNIRAVLVNAAGDVLSSSHRRRASDPADMVEAMVEMVEELAAGSAEPIAAVGVGMAGIVDGEGVVRTSPNIPTLKHFPIRARLEDRLNLPIIADNDGTTAAWAEAATGAGVGYDDVILVALGTGIGGGLVIDGEVRRGTSGFAGEIGHMIVDPAGPRCVCGRTGCWERFGSGTALGNQSRAAARAGRAPALLALAAGNPEDVQGEHLSELIAAGDADALGILEEFGRHVAVGLNNLVNIVDPAIVIIGGGLAEIGAPLIEAIRAGYADIMVDIEVRDSLPIVAAAHGGLAGSLGAALLAGE